MNSKEITNLEQQAEALLKAYQRVQQKNSQLLAEKSALLEQQQTMQQRFNQASDQIKSMITRLKTIEGLK